MEALVGLPLVVAVVFVELAIGGAALLWFLDRDGTAPAGFRKLVAVVDVAAIAVAAAIIPALPTRAGAGQLHTDAVGAFAQTLPVLVVLVIAQGIAAFLPWRTPRSITGILTGLAGLASLGIAASARPGQSPWDVFALLAPMAGALALGGANAAMLLGHWYLVTPKLSPGPLRLAALVVVGAVAVQTLLVAVAIARGELVGITQTALWVAVGIRIGVGLAMTGGVALAAWWTARMNTQSSTGLLYVGLGCALAGEVAARVVFYLLPASI